MQYKWAISVIMVCDILYTTQEAGIFYMSQASLKLTNVHNRLLIIVQFFL